MYSKNDVQFHSDRRGPSHPAVNVKAHRLGCTSKAVMDRFKCSEDDAEHAIELAFESACDLFWEDAQETADFFKLGGKVYSEGRSSGWLVVHGLKDFESWDAVDLMKWYRFEKAILEEVKYRTSEEVMLDDIDVNKWYLHGSEKYNFFDKKNGETGCFAELKKQAIDAGFGLVVRA